VSRSVLDASALLALLKRELGSDQVALAIESGSEISAVNLAEVVAKLAEATMPEPMIHETLDSLGLDVVPFDHRLAYRSGLLRVATKQYGLSLGDRCCLALAQDHGLPLLTADQVWRQLSVGVSIQVIR
jgi:ribonuclease VapC